VNVLLSNKGTLLRADVSGQIMVKSLLSGMPECKFGLNDKLVLPNEGSRLQQPRSSGTGPEIVIDDCRFHQCVRLSKYDTERTVTFTPPDGVFELMQYRITENIQCPFKIIPVLQDRGRSRYEILVKLKSLFGTNIYATHVVLAIPTPKTTARVNVHNVSHGKAKQEQNQLVWRIRRFSGHSESTLSAEVELAATSPERQWAKPPLSLDFQVPMFTATGLRVRFLRVHEKSNYVPVKWIRYITKAGSYQHRI